MINKLFAILIAICLLSAGISAQEKVEKDKAPAGALGKHYITAKQGLNIRSEPNKSGAVIVKMHHGAEVNILAYSDNEDEIEGNKSKWVQLKYKSKFKTYTGWAFGHYISKDKP
jgi:uncharacterized protein YgiM (DUF1202 family)